MKNNDILRRLRYIFEINDSKMITIFGLGNLTVTRAEISDWLKKEEDPDFQKCNDTQLAIFLNGFINEKRGKQEGAPPQLEKRLTNNKVFNKIKIALNLKAEDVIALLDSVDFQISKSELSAFFRKPGHKHFMECKDQILRLFLKGLELKHHNVDQSDSGFKWKK